MDQSGARAHPSTHGTQKRGRGRLLGVFSLLASGRVVSAFSFYPNSMAWRRGREMGGVIGQEDAKAGVDSKFQATRRSQVHRMGTVRRVSSIPNTGQTAAWFGDDPGLSGYCDVIHVHDLLLQRAIQTQLAYYNEMHNELLSSWLTGFLDHSHLDAGEKWHAVVGMRVPLVEYFRELMAQQPTTVEVHVRVGGGRAWSDATDEDDPSSDAKMDLVPQELKPWEAAAASRRNNPYLQEPKEQVYEETVQPQLIASALMGVVSHLATEWREDLALQFVADDPTSISQKRMDDDEAERCEGDMHAPSTFDSAERYRSGSTPLRRQNFDLLQRSATILALKALEAELAFMSRTDGRRLRELEYLDDFCAGWWPRLSGVVRDQDGKLEMSISEAMLDELSRRPPVSRDQHLIDPHSLGDRLLEHRQKVELKLGKQLEDTESILVGIRREALERSMLESSIRWE